jgi:hypothetical protein
VAALASQGGQRLSKTSQREEMVIEVNPTVLFDRGGALNSSICFSWLASIINNSKYIDRGKP